MISSTSAKPAPIGETAILMAVYNGERFLEEQIRSLADQTVAHVSVWAADDGSSDASPQILEAARRNWTKGAFHVLAGPRRGFVENFRGLVTRPDIDAEYVAFCDQDDIWAPGKLAVAIAWLAGRDRETPAIHCARTRLVDEKGVALGYSPLFGKPPGFRNALVQNIAGGNTMVLNRAAHELVAEASRRTGFIIHDWWSYIIVTGAGGAVRYSPEPTVDYRQHGANIIGSDDSARARLGRYMSLWQGGLAAWTDRNLAGLQACRDLLDDEGRDLLDRFCRLRKMPLPRRLVELSRLGLYRQTAAAQLGLQMACLIGRL